MICFIHSAYPPVNWYQIPIMTGLICCLPSPRPLPIDSLLKLLSSTQGRDKIYRLIQYFSRFLAFYLSKMSPSAEFVSRIQKLSVSIGMARKRNLIEIPVAFDLFIYF